VCEIGSISRAAGELNIAQPALGLQIRSLEDEYGAELVARHSRGVTPTAAGLLVLEWSREIIRQNRDLRRRVREIDHDHPASFSLGLTASLSHLIAGAVIETARDELPGVRIKIVEGASQFIADWVDNQHVDIGLGFGPLSNHVDATALLNEKLFYLWGPGVEGDTITLAQVLSQPLAVPDENNSIREAIEGAARTVEMPVIGDYEIMSLEAARDIARRGIAGSIVPYGGIVRDLARGELTARLIVEPTIERTLFLMRRRERTNPKQEDAFVALVLKVLRERVSDESLKIAYKFVNDDTAVNAASSS
jgi:LysR family nitrogen assimilation transcriptional regulator